MNYFNAKHIAAPLLAAAVAFGGLSASAQQQEGLVNVAIGDINVQVPIGVAANVCNITANVLASDNETRQEGCMADAQAAAENRQFMRRAEAQGVADDILALLDAG